VGNYFRNTLQGLEAIKFIETRDEVQQKDLAVSQVEIDIATNQATARKAETDGRATYTQQTGEAEAAVIRRKALLEPRGIWPRSRRSARYRRPWWQSQARSAQGM
jgi:hypothetical protein